MQSKNRFFTFIIGTFSLALLLCFFIIHQALAAQSLSHTVRNTSHNEWRIRIHEAAVVQGDMVRLGDIAEVFGMAPQDTWAQLANRALWPAPPEEGKPFIINRARLTRALRQSLGNYADICIIPSQLALQRGGSVVREEALRGLVVKNLTPFVHALSGQSELVDFRLPPYVFLQHQGQQISLEPLAIKPGRLSLEFLVRELDGTQIRRFTGTAMLHVWQEVPSPSVQLSRGDAIHVSQINLIRQNLAFAKGEVWDGRGGPWQVKRSISPGQVILASDIEPLAMIGRGEVITLEYRKGSVLLQVQAEALADGGLGDTILVRNLQSKKQIYAKVFDANRVVIQ